MGVGVTVTAVVVDELKDGELEGLADKAAVSVPVTQADKVEVLQAEDDAETVRLLLCVGVLVPLDDSV